MDKPCKLWPGPFYNTGYGRVKGTHTLAHRYTWEQVNGPLPEGTVLRHECDNPPCVELSHLIPGTQTDNVRDMYRRGRQGNYACLGEKNGIAKFTVQDVLTIRQRALTEKQTVIAEDYGVTRQAINLIVKRKNWCHI